MKKREKTAALDIVDTQTLDPRRTKLIVALRKTLIIKPFSAAC